MKKRIIATVPGACDEDLARVHDAGFGEFARSAAPGLLELLRTAGISAGRVVDLGCGSGIWAKELAAASYDVTGVDISPAMIALARERVPQGEFHVESCRTYALPSCRAVTALGEVLNYLHDRRQSASQLVRLFRRVHSALEPGGLLIFDVAEPGRSEGRAPCFWEGDDWACLVRFETDRAKQRLCRRIVTFRKVGELYRRSEVVHRLQLYRGTELAERLREIGFRVRLLRRYGEFPLLPGLVGLVARKP